MMKFFHPSSPISDDWRVRADPKDLREYDAFGPWIYPVHTLEEMPPRFRSWYDELHSSTFLLKVPINAERSALRPGMDLYRSALAVYPEQIVVLEWSGSNVIRRDIDMSAIQAVRMSSDLLPSELSLYIADGGIFRLKYNAVSSHEIEKIVEFLRNRMIACRPLSARFVSTESGRSGGDIRDHFYRGIWAMRCRHNPSARILHWEPPGIRCRSYGGWGKSSLGCLVLDEGDDLAVFYRGQFMRSWRETVYSTADLYIPWAAVQSSELIGKPSGRNRRIPTVRINLQGHHVDLELFAPTAELDHLVSAISS